MPYTEAEISDAVETLRQSLAQSGLDVGPGSAIDSLLIYPQARLAAGLGRRVDSALNVLRLSEIAAGQISVDAQDLDNYLQLLGLVRQLDNPARGFVRMWSTNEQSRTINAGVSMRIRQRRFTVVRTTELVPSTDGGVETDSRIFYRRGFGPDGETYFVDIEVQAGDSGPEYVAGPGEVVTQLPAWVSSARTFSLYGGEPQESNARFAERALQQATPPSLAGARAADRLLPQLYPNASASLVGPSSLVNLRVPSQLFPLSSGAAVDMWVKSGPPVDRVVPLDAVVVDQANRIVRLTLPAEEAAGAYRISAAAFPLQPQPAAVAGAITTTDIAYQQVPLWGREPVITEVEDLRYAAAAEVVVEFEDDRIDDQSDFVVALPSDGTTVTGQYAAALTYQPGVKEVAREVYRGEVGVPGVDYLVRPAIPIEVIANWQVSIGDDADQPPTDDVRSFIAAAINALPVRLRRLETHTISRQLSDAYPGLSIVSATFSGTLLLPDGGQQQIPAAAGSLISPLIPQQRVGPESTFFSARRSDMGVNFV